MSRTMPSTRLMSVAPLIAPDDLSICDMRRGLFGVQRAECKVQSGRDRGDATRSNEVKRRLLQAAVAVMANVELRPLEDCLVQPKRGLERREEGVAFALALDHGEIQVGTAR